MSCRRCRSRQASNSNTGTTMLLASGQPARRRSVGREELSEDVSDPLMTLVRGVHQVASLPEPVNVRVSAWHAGPSGEVQHRYDGRAAGTGRVGRGDVLRGGDVLAPRIGEGALAVP